MVKAIIDAPQQTIVKKRKVLSEVGAAQKSIVKKRKIQSKCTWAAIVQKSVDFLHRENEPMANIARQNAFLRQQIQLMKQHVEILSHSKTKISGKEDFKLKTIHKTNHDSE